MDRMIPSRLTENARWANDKSMLRYTRKGFYRGRNYDLFSMLSNVRGNLNSLCPKGEYGNCNETMPHDTSDKIFNEHRHYSAHSLTIFTLKQLLVDNKAFWEQTVECDDYQGNKIVPKTYKYSELAHEFLENCEAVARYAKHKNLDKWRLVMWYDN